MHCSRSLSELDASCDALSQESTNHSSGDDFLRWTSRKTKLFILSQLLVLGLVSTYLLYLHPTVSSGRAETLCSGQLGGEKGEKHYFITQRGDSFTYKSSSVSEAKKAVCISGSRLSAFTSPRIMESFEKYVLGANNNGWAQGFAAASVDLYIHAFYEGPPEPIIEMLNRYRPYLRGFVIRRYDEEYRNELETEAHELVVMGQGTNAVNLWRGVHLCHTLLRQQELLQMRRYDAVFRARPDILYHDAVDFDLYAQPTMALYIPKPHNCCGLDKDVPYHYDNGTSYWWGDVVGINDQAAIGSSYAMERYSNLLPVYVAVNRTFMHMSERTLHDYLIEVLKITTFKADFTYGIERLG